MHWVWVERLWINEIELAALQIFRALEWESREILPFLEYNYRSWASRD